MTIQNRSERGTIYLLVLMASVIVTLIGLMGFRMIRAQAAIAQADTERDEAMVIAESAVQWGIHIVTLKEDWRDEITSGVPVRTGAFGEGTMSLEIIDEDDDLADDEQEDFTIVGTGIVGNAEQILEVTVSPGTGKPHPALDKSLTLGGHLKVNPLVLSLESGGTASSQAKRDGRTLFPPEVDIENPVDLPDPSLIETWAAMGTVIRADQHSGSFSNVTFSKSSAPAGVSVDPNGIYILDADEEAFNLIQCTVQGTLIVVNLDGGEFNVNESRLLFGDHGGPTLLVDGDLKLDTGWSIGVHQGIIYADGDIRITDNFMMVGVMMATGNVSINAGYVSINDHPSATAGPPEGFNDNEGYEIVPGSWRRVVN